MRKNFVLILAGLFLVAGLVGCGEKGPRIDASSDASLESTMMQVQEYAAEQDREKEWALSVYVMQQYIALYAGVPYSEMNQEFKKMWDGKNLDEIVAQSESLADEHDIDLAQLQDVMDQANELLDGLY